MPILESLLSSGVLSGIGGAIASSRGAKKELGQSIADTIKGVGDILSSEMRARRTNQFSQMISPTLPESTAFKTRQLLQGLDMDESSFKNIASGLSSMEKLKQDREMGTSLMGRMSRNTLGQLAMPVLGGGLLVTGGALASSALNAVDAVNMPSPLNDLIRNRVLPEVLNLKPNLKNLDKSLLIQYYNVIYRYAPSVAKDIPVVANILERLMNYGGPDNSFIKELAETEKSISSRRLGSVDIAARGANIF